MQPALVLKPGDSVGRFKLSQVLGHGRGGTSFAASDSLLNHPVVVKVIDPAVLARPDAVARLHREVAAARRVAHPGLRKLFDVHEVDGHCLLSMEFVAGQSLAHALALSRRMPWERAAQIVRGAAAALEAAHAAGMVHGDITASDVLIRADDSVCVLDFGLASALHVLTRGTRPLPAADQRALGALLFLAVSGGPLVLDGAPPPLMAAMDAALPRALDDIIGKATAARAENRFRDLAAFGAALDGMLGPLVAPTVDLTMERTQESKHLAPREELPPDATEALPQRPDTVSLPTAEALPSLPEDDATLPLSPQLAAADLPDLDPANATHDDSASWVVAGQPVHLPVVPKLRTVSEGPSGTEPVPGRKRAQGRTPALAAAALLLAAALAGGVMMARRGARAVDDAAPLAAMDAGVVADAAAHGRAPSPVHADGGTAGATNAGPEPDAAALVMEKGLIVGDDVEVDRLLSRIQHPTDAEEAQEAMAALRVRLVTVEIDKRLVTRKLGRLRSDSRDLGDAKERARLERVADAIAETLKAGGLVDANRALNQAFAQLPRAHIP